MLARIFRRGRAAGRPDPPEDGIGDAPRTGSESAATPSEEATAAAAAPPRTPAPTPAHTDVAEVTPPSDGDPTEAPPPLDPGQRASPSVVVPRWIQLVVLPLALLGLWALARAAGPVLLILVAASTIALILNPLVKTIEHRGVPHGLSILLVYLSLIAALVGVGILLSDPISTQISHFQRDVPHLVKQANKDLHNVQTWLDNNGIKVQIEKQGQTALQTLQKNLLKRSGDIVSFSRDLLSQIVTFSFDLVLVIVLSIYLLVYGPTIGRLARRVMPPGDGTPEDDYPLLIQQAVFGYVRGQILFSFIMGASAALSLEIFGLLGIFPDGSKYAVFFGAFYGLMEFIPYIGPIIGPAPAVLVALFNDPLSAVWLIALFVALQQLEGHIVAPQVFRISLRINPILIILGLLIGYQIYGIVGALVALPVASVIRQTVIYLRRHLVLEPWAVAVPASAAGAVGPAGPASGTGARAAPGTSPEAETAGLHGGDDAPPLGLLTERCPDCGAETGGRDAFCRACGAQLEPRVRARR